MSQRANDDFGAARRTLQSSALWTAAASSWSAIRSSADDSMTVAVWRRGRAAIDRMNRRERMRSMFAAGAIAALTHVVLLTVVPPALRPALPRMFWVMVSVGAALAAWAMPRQASDA